MPYFIGAPPPLVHKLQATPCPQVAGNPSIPPQWGEVGGAARIKQHYIVLRRGSP